MFVPKGSRFLLVMSNTSTSLRYIYTIGALSVLGGAWYFFVFDCLRVMIDSSYMSIAGIHAQLDAVSRSKMYVHKHKEMVQQLESEINGYISKQSHGQVVQEVINELFALAKQVGVVMSTCILGTEKNKSWCTNVQLTICLKGTYDQLIAFFTALHEKKRLISCKIFHAVREQVSVYNAKAVITVRVITAYKK